ncbi:cupin domain-containing protein [Piscinibacter sakaiensis]|uniref:Sll1163 protein n=1 Tax=Piscinibacter sakaiensis TaxID=1547922 RepID=A0A0K8P7U3_PISS1|nr:cupin domain-containing protein [Piscinibacter sakaiensis]GAP38265.1 Sll1163 protein [Piscinibacter sakaiensis]
MHQDRVLDAADHFRSGEDEPPRVVIAETAEAAVVCWQVEPGQRLALHRHPSGQDTWIVLSGEGLYVTDTAGTTRPLAPGVVAIAPAGAVHGVLATGDVPLRFVSVVSPALSGFEPVDGEPPTGPG